MAACGAPDQTSGQVHARDVAYVVGILGSTVMVCTNQTSGHCSSDVAPVEAVLQQPGIADADQTADVSRSGADDGA